MAKLVDAREENRIAELDKDRLLSLYPFYDSVSDPCTRKDGRKTITLSCSSNFGGEKVKSTTVSYPKALVESIRGERLKPNETIDHRDRNFTNDDPGNLIIKDRSIHCAEDALRVYVEDAFCIICSKTFTPTRNQITKRAESKPGPFCSKECAGFYNASFGKIEKKEERLKIEKYYYQRDKQ